MTSEKLKNFAIINVLLILSGVIMIFFSVRFGTSLADSWLSSRGGADTGYYHIIVKGYMNSFLAAGGIILGFGLVFFTLASYKLLNFKD